jgi:hypothetical protein
MTEPGAASDCCCNIPITLIDQRSKRVIACLHQRRATILLRIKPSSQARSFNAAKGKGLRVWPSH